GDRSAPNPPVSGCRRVCGPTFCEHDLSGCVAWLPRQQQRSAHDSRSDVLQSAPTATRLRAPERWAATCARSTRLTSGWRPAFSIPHTPAAATHPGTADRLTFPDFQRSHSHSWRHDPRVALRPSFTKRIVPGFMGAVDQNHGARAVPARSMLVGTVSPEKPETFQQIRLLRAGTARAPVAVSRCAQASGNPSGLPSCADFADTPLAL